MKKYARKVMVAMLTAIVLPLSAQQREPLPKTISDKILSEVFSSDKNGASYSFNDHRKYWTPKANAAIWCEWVTGKWKTNVTGFSDKKESVSVRGHLGSYTICVTYKGKVTEMESRLGKQGADIQVKL